MELTLESGQTIRKATESDILSLLKGEEFAILSAGEWTYMQCAQQEEEPFEYVLEYQEGTLENHYQAVDDPITLERVQAAFIKYLRGDSSWQADFAWEKLDLNDLETSEDDQ